MSPETERVIKLWQQSDTERDSVGMIRDKMDVVFNIVLAFNVPEADSCFNGSIENRFSIGSFAT